MIRVFALIAALAAPLAWPGPAPAPSSAPSKAWDSWYTVTVGKSTRYAYYNDKVEYRPDGKVFFQNRFWKKEEGYLNEEALGAIALNDSDLTPQFFNFYSTYRATETKIDGVVREGKHLAVRVRKGNTELPIIRRGVSPRVIFSVFFPVWIGKKLASAKPGAKVAFMTILEDGVDLGFQTIHGNFKIEPPDDFAKRNQVTKLAVDYRDIKSIWYVRSNGMPERIEMPTQHTLIQRAPADQAKAFLDE